MSNVQRVTIHLSQDGLQTKYKSSIVLLARAAGAITHDNQYALAGGLVDVLCSVLFARTYISRVSMVEIQKGNIVVPGTNFTRGFNRQGDTAFPDGAVYAPDFISVAIDKGTANGHTGRTLIPYSVTSEEFNQYQIDGTMPARFTESPVGSYGAGESIVTNLFMILNAANYSLQLPADYGVLSTSYNQVVDLSLPRIVKSDRSKKRITTERAAANAAKRKLNEWMEQIRRLINGVALVDLAADVITVITAIILAGTEYYAALPLAIRALVAPPTWPALP